MYRCEICQAVAPPRSPRLVHVVRRADGQVAREWAVCRACYAILVGGTPLATLMRRHAAPKPAVVVRQAVQQAERFLF